MTWADARLLRLLCHDAALPAPAETWGVFEFRRPYLLRVGFVRASLAIQSVPLCPAYYVAVDRRARSIDVVVRGTSALHDIVADVCGHCEPFFGGHAHFGMLRAAQFILAQVWRAKEGGGTASRFFGGHAHFGMLRAAQFILAQVWRAKEGWWGLPLSAPSPSAPFTLP
eukprot:364516-Chlamydomonas_euryale.AAC.19